MASSSSLQFTIFPDGEVAVSATSRDSLHAAGRQLHSKLAIRHKKTSLPYENMLNENIVAIENLPLTALFVYTVVRVKFGSQNEGQQML